VRGAMMGLRKFLFERVYRNTIALEEEKKIINMIKNLYEYYMVHPELLPQFYLDMIESGKSEKAQAICDYIAGMTDTYAIEKFREYFIPKSWKN
jgi:dGTPase